MKGKKCHTYTDCNTCFSIVKDKEKKKRNFSRTFDGYTGAHDKEPVVVLPDVRQHSRRLLEKFDKREEIFVDVSPYGVKTYAPPCIVLLARVKKGVLRHLFLLFYEERLQYPLQLYHIFFGSDRVGCGLGEKEWRFVVNYIDIDVCSGFACKTESADFSH